MNLGRYEVVRELGKGAMGIVYLARDPLIGRLVALKTIRLTDSGDEEEVREFQQRFIREAQAAGVLSHPSIVTVHDIGQDDEKGFSFIAMEYVEGPTLKEVIQQGKAMDVGEVATILAHVAEALDYAHASGIVHRDVKPANIILYGEHRVKITDFGIAKIASEAVNLTTTGQFLGTPNYMAPEQVKGTPVDGRTDIFSLGIVLYECLTRRKPFGGDSLTTISYRIVHEPFDSPNSIDPTIPPVFDEVVNRCLAKDPKDRYQRARDLAKDLRAIAAGRPLPPPSSEPLGDPTVIGGRIPTMEFPFPEAQPAPGASAAGSRKKTSDSALRRTISKPVPKPAFFGTIAALALLLLIAGGWIWAQRVEVPEVDTSREALVARQRELRTDGMRLLQQGNVEGAYQRFSALQKIAPESPQVAEMVARLDQIRGEQAGVQMRGEQSLAKLEEGKKLYAARQYARAIPLFEEAFNLDPRNTDAVNFLSMSREQMALRDMREAQTMASKAVAETPGDRLGGDAASLQIEFAGGLDKGYVMVQIDGEKIFHELLYEERGVFRRRSPRAINARSEVPPGSHEVVVWAVIPELRITERQVFQKQFSSGGAHRVVINFDARAKKFTINLS